MGPTTDWPQAKSNLTLQFESGLQLVGVTGQEVTCWAVIEVEAEGKETCYWTTIRSGCNFHSNNIWCRMGTERRIGVIEVRHPAVACTLESGGAKSFAVDAATSADASAVIDVVSDAFLDDPTWSWAFPDPMARRVWWTFCIREALRYPWTFKTKGYETVSVWIPPDGTELSHEAELGVPGRLTDLVGSRATDVGELLDRFGQAHPRHEPHYYLSLLGTRSEHRGRGLGIALLEENLARIDAEHMPAYLESSNPNNNHRYESVGFVAVSSFQAPGHGPFVTGMWRSSR